MRKHIFVPCIIILAICLWLLWLTRHQNAEPQKPTVATNIEIQQTQTQNVGFRHVSAITNPPVNVVQQVTNLPRRGAQPPTPDEVYHMYDPWRTPINFYGKVIDENSNPVEGATASFGWTDLSPPQGHSQATTTSDINGLFALEGKTGLHLSVSVNKKGYYSSKSNLDSFFYAEHNGNNFVPDAGNPVVFHLRKKGQGVELVTSANGLQSSLAALVPINGDPVKVDLLDQKVGASGDLELSQVKPDRSHWQSATNWSFHMSIPAGGFIEEEDAFPFTAPETGYQTMVDLTFVKGDPDWTTQISKTYYIAFGQPQKYGWLRVEANIAQQTVFLTYAINPTGSRNLEPAQ